MTDPKADDTARRIVQLEAALMRRTELLEQKQSELANIKASKAYRTASTVQKILDRLLPLHTTRRAIVKGVVRKALSIPRRIWKSHRALNGPSIEQRFDSEG